MNRIDRDKIATVIKYLLQWTTNTYGMDFYISKMRLMRLLYLVDKTHLEIYGRTVSSDIYLADAKNGAVPMYAHEIIIESEISDKYGFTHKEHEFKIITLANTDQLSISDTKTMHWIISRYGNLPKWHLRMLAMGLDWKIAIDRGERLVSEDIMAETMDDGDILIDYLHN